MSPISQPPVHAPIDDLLRALVADSATHARFLNTVSLLEYIGARKIMKSQDDAAFDLELLSHVAEESRHALIVKKLALKVDAQAARSYDPSCLLCRDVAVGYIQKLDRHIEEELEKSGSVENLAPGKNKRWLNYLYTSLLIEERATWLYPQYEAVLEEAGLGGNLRTILKDEAKHLGNMRKLIAKNDGDYAARVEGFRTVEANLFDAFTSALGSVVRQAA